MLNANTFGQLVRSYREQRGWSQEELAERWGHSREYVSQIERGKRKLDSMTQAMRLADILDIPQEKLEANRESSSSFVCGRFGPGYYALSQRA